MSESMDNDNIDSELGTVMLILVLLDTLQVRFVLAIRSLQIGVLLDGVMVGGRLIRIYDWLSQAANC